MEDEIDEVTLPLLMALERAVFLLHDVFGLDVEEVAATIDREPATCRQLASRAHVRADHPRYPVPRKRGVEIAEALFAASRDGDMESLHALLAADVTLYADGGDKAPTRKVPAAVPGESPASGHRRATAHRWVSSLIGWPIPALQTAR